MPVPSGPLAGLPYWPVIGMPNAIWVQVGGTWRAVSDVWTMTGGAWQRTYRNNVNDTALGNVLSGIVANDREIRDPSMVGWQEFWQSPAGTTEKAWVAAESAIKLTLNSRNPDGTAVTRLGPPHPQAVAPGWRVRLDADVKGTARMTLGVVTAATYEDCEILNPAAQWQESGYLPVPDVAAFETRTAEFAVPAGHAYLKPYASAWITTDQPTGSRTLTVARFQPVRIT